MCSAARRLSRPSPRSPAPSTRMPRSRPTPSPFRRCVRGGCGGSEGVPCMSSTYPSLPRPPPAALQDPAVTCVSVDAIVDSGAGPTTASSLSLVGGQRDAACAVVLRLRHAASAGAQGPDGSAAAFTIVSSSGGLSFAVTAAAGFDTTLSLGPLLPGSPSPLSLQLQQGGAPVGDPVAVPATCAAAAEAPAFSVPNGTTVSAPSESLAVLVRCGPHPGDPCAWAPILPLRVAMRGAIPHARPHLPPLLLQARLPSPSHPRPPAPSCTSP